MQELIKKISEQLELLLTPPLLLQVIGLLVATVLAWWAGVKFQRTEEARRIRVQAGIQARLKEGLVIIAPHVASLVVVAAFAGILHASRAQTQVVDGAISLIGLLLLIRLGVYVARITFGERTKGWGNTISLAIWLLVALHVLGLFDPVVQALDSVGIRAGKTRITVWSVIKVIVTVGVFIVVAATIARWIERRLMEVQGLALSMRIGIAKFTQAFLIALSILLGLNAAGLDLTTLNVLTGAIGIGLGFGLQAIASNFVSGFVLLMDRSIKPGDVISFTGTTGTATEGFGWVQELRGRYVVVRDRDGVETLVPNQNLITNPVINWSYTDPKVRLKLPVRVSYQCDPEKALALLLKAAEGHPRILRDPPPVSRLIAFGDYGFELEARFWISDPQEGVNNVRSDVNRLIWRLFKDNGIVIPVPQRDVYLHDGAARVQNTGPLKPPS